MHAVPVPAQVHPSRMQLLQPSPGTLLASSHSSPRSSLPLPQSVSIWHVEEQPSPEKMLPSSQVSPASVSIMRLPQTGVHPHGPAEQSVSAVQTVDDSGATQFLRQKPKLQERSEVQETEVSDKQDPTHVPPLVQSLVALQEVPVRKHVPIAPLNTHVLEHSVPKFVHFTLGRPLQVP